MATEDNNTAAVGREPKDLPAWVKVIDDARHTYPRPRRPLMRVRQSGTGRSKRPWIGERSSVEVERREQQRAEERQKKRNAQAAMGEQFSPEPTTTFIGGTPRADIQPFNGGRKLQQMAALRLTHTPIDPTLQDALVDMLGADFAGHGFNEPLRKQRTVGEAHEIMADLLGPRPAGPTHGNDKDMSSALVRRDVGRIVDKLERDPRIRFNLIAWAKRNIVGGFPGPDEWHICLCVKHNVHPETGAPLSPWKGKPACARRLQEFGAEWADANDPFTTFRKYQYYLGFGSQAMSVAKWRTLHEEEHRRQVWVLDEKDEGDPDFRTLERPDPDVLQALVAKFLKDRGL